MRLYIFDNMSYCHTNRNVQYQVTGFVPVNRGSLLTTEIEVYNTAPTCEVLGYMKGISGPVIPRSTSNMPHPSLSNKPSRLEGI